MPSAKIAGVRLDEELVLKTSSSERDWEFESPARYIAARRSLFTHTPTHTPIPTHNPTHTHTQIGDLVEWQRRSPAKRDWAGSIPAFPSKA